METNSVGHSFACGAARYLSAGRHALIALMTVAIAACGDTDSVTGPPVPGSISVTTETTGFFKDDSYELLVDGESQGTIGANDAVTIPELDPATYDVSLGDVAENCVVEGTSVTVDEDQTAEVSLAVVCAPDAPTEYLLRASRDRPDLDTGEVLECSFGICPSDEAWDIWVEFENTEPQAHIRQNQTAGNEVEIAHLSGVTLSELTEEDYEAATFSTEFVESPFGTDTVVLVRTQLGNVYALGNPVEDTVVLELAFDAVLIVAAS